MWSESQVRIIPNLHLELPICQTMFPRLNVHYLMLSIPQNAPQGRPSIAFI